MDKLFFFLICPLGLEDLLQKELMFKASPFTDQFKIIKVEEGGIEIEAGLDFGLFLNKLLKIPSRILLRVKNQKCRDLPKLYNIIKRIHWKTYLRQENIKFKITAKKSRLIHTSKIEESATKAIQDYFSANKIKASNILTRCNEQLIFLRFENDNLTISLDTSGDLLHKRSNSKFRGHAGIRENIAAALLLELLGLDSNYKNYQNLKLIDPMCGSGTFLREAKKFFKLNDQDFAFQNWNISTIHSFKIDQINLWPFGSLKGIEIDETIYKQLNKFETDIKFINDDFFKHVDKTSSIIIMNPPYGKRIKIPGKKTQYYKKILDNIQDNFCAVKIGMIIPKDCSIHFQAKTRLRFSQNGIAVEFLIF